MQSGGSRLIKGQAGVQAAGRPGGGFAPAFIVWPTHYPMSHSAWLMVPSCFTVFATLLEIVTCFRTLV